MKSLTTLAKTKGRSLTELISLHKAALDDMVPPKRHLLRYKPATLQTGVMVCVCVCMLRYQPATVQCVTVFSIVVMFIRFAQHLWSTGSAIGLILVQ